MKNIVELGYSEIDEISGGNECTQDIALSAAGVAATIAIVAAPLTFGASLAVAAAAGLAIGVGAGSAQSSCS
ncbi:hypothetical protein [Novosphingopyxis iocasae]|uniref:hypothetical protein n=1 Tax=Novosphingopyxis iocasae TaxID=2762729 RepID=UPI0016519510|nr:hypothetical protein [Novosphingopyxis iocasae]|tara:strand:+ start:471 stop:686 length:216 start_codon:yes stop_codon:yes gene_type:complete